MIVTIDGPAGAGKSSAARRLAQRLGFLFLDTGAMYRAVALAAVENNVDLKDEAALAELAAGLSIEFDEQNRVLLNGRDVSEKIRTRRITLLTRHSADNPRVREHLVGLQRKIAAGRDVVAEGRDQGTVAFPHAECKILLTASPRERAKRRHKDLQQRGEAADLAEVLAEQEARDRQDRSRPIGALRKAPDAIEVDTDSLSPKEVVDRLETLVRERQPQ